MSQTTTTTQSATLSVEQKRELLAEMLREKAQKPKFAPLSFTQERFWLLEQIMSERSPGIVQIARLCGQLDVAALEKALNELVRRHEILRTTIMTMGGNPVQVITPHTPLSLPIVDLSHLPTAEREAQIQQRADAEASIRFDLTQGPLFRINLLKLGEEEHILALNLHHIVADGWSMSILIRELVTLYQAFCVGRPSPLPELPIQYADFARWQRERLEGKAMDEHLAYWKQQLGDAPAMFDLPTDRPRPPVQTLHGAGLSLALPESLRQGLKALSQQEGCSLFMALIAGLGVLLHRYSGQEDICIGTIIANRTTRQLEGLIGFFTNPLVLRVDLSGNPTFRELLHRVRETTLEAYAHQDLPFDMILKEVRTEGYLGYTPWLQVKMLLQNMPIPTIETPGLTIELLRAEGEAQADSDLTLFLWEALEGLGGIVGYNTDIFDESTVRRMIDHLSNTLEAATATPDERVAALPLMTLDEQQRLVVELNQTQADYPAGATIQELFIAQAKRSPRKVAVSFAGETLTYAELNARANQLAHYLQDRGIGPDVLVGIAIPRSLDLIVALLGVLKAGGTYLPLDPAYPPERLAFMMADAEIRVLLTVEELAGVLPPPDTLAIVLDNSVRAAIGQESSEEPDNRTEPEHMAYVIYTSGSTGQPKGVMITQRSLIQHTTAAIGHFKITPQDRVLQFASISFDTAAEEIYPCLLNGATLVLRTDEMLSSVETFLQTCADEGITVLDLPTAYWHTIIPELGLGDLQWPPDLRLIILGGEKALPKQLQAWYVHAPTHIRLTNTYGPTETTIVVTLCDLNGKRAPVSATRAPIGKPIANTQVYVLDPHLQPVPVGVPGELYIGGDGLARGYLCRPGATAERFLPDPFRAVAGARLYRTGDLVRYLADDNIEFLGRVDHQVKIRGFRVELGEIEALLLQHSDVGETVVVAHDVEHEPGSKQLVAYVVPATEQRPNIGDLRDSLKEKLPEHMVPSAFVLLDALPLTPSGKVDRRALPSPETAQHERKEYVAPEGPLEEKLAEIWSKILAVEKIGIYDDFFDLGGHSLTATQLIYHINKALQMDLSVRSIFEEPTIAGQALLIEEILIEELENEEEAIEEQGF